MVLSANPGKITKGEKGKKILDIAAGAGCRSPFAHLLQFEFAHLLSAVVTMLIDKTPIGKMVTKMKCNYAAGERRR